MHNEKLNKQEVKNKISLLIENMKQTSSTNLSNAAFDKLKLDVVSAFSDCNVHLEERFMSVITDLKNKRRPLFVDKTTEALVYIINNLN